MGMGLDWGGACGTGWELGMNWIWGYECKCWMVRSRDVIWFDFRIGGGMGRDEDGVGLETGMGLEMAEFEVGNAYVDDLEVGKRLGLGLGLGLGVENELDLVLVIG